MNLSRNVKITKVVANTATGTSTINGSTLDMQGFDGVLFLASIGSAAANNGIKAQQGQLSGMGDAADLANTQVLSNGTQTELVLDVYKPQDRYVRVAVVRGTTTVIDSVWALQYSAAKKPQNNVTVAQAAELWASPAEGTA